MRRSESNSPAPMEGLPGTPHRNRRRGNTIPPPFHLFRPTSKRFPSRKLQSARMSCMKYRPITRILSLAAALFILTACTPHNLPVHDLRRRPGYTHRPLHRYMQRLRRTASRLATLRRGYVHLSDNGYRQTGKAEAMDSRHPQGRRTAHRLPLRRQRAGSTPHQHADRQGNLRHLRPRHLRRRRPDAGNLP